MTALSAFMLVVVGLMIGGMWGVALTMYWTSNHIRNNYQAKINHEHE